MATPLTSIWKTITEDRFMTKKLPKRGLPPMHPGELLREEILPALDRSKTEIARLLGVSRQTLYDVLAEKQPVTPGMALRLGKLCGNDQENSNATGRLKAESCGSRRVTLGA